MKRKFSEDGLTCSDVRGVGFEFVWRVPNVAHLLHKRLPVTSEWLEVGGMICEILLQPHVSTHATGLETLGLMLSMLDGQEGHNLPGSVRFQVVNILNPCWCATVEEGHGVLRLGRNTWAAEQLIPVATLLDPAAGFVVGDRLTIRVEARYG